MNRGTSSGGGFPRLGWLGQERSECQRDAADAPEGTACELGEERSGVAGSGASDRLTPPSCPSHPSSRRIERHGLPQAPGGGAVIRAHDLQTAWVAGAGVERADAPERQACDQEEERSGATGSGASSHCATLRSLLPQTPQVKKDRTARLPQAPGGLLGTGTVVVRLKHWQSQCHPKGQGAARTRPPVPPADDRPCWCIGALRSVGCHWLCQCHGEGMSPSERERSSGVARTGKASGTQKCKASIGPGCQCHPPARSGCNLTLQVRQHLALRRVPLALPVPRGTFELFGTGTVVVRLKHWRSQCHPREQGASCTRPPVPPAETRARASPQHAYSLKAAEGMPPRVKGRSHAISMPPRRRQHPHLGHPFCKSEGQSGANFPPE